MRKKDGSDKSLEIPDSWSTSGIVIVDEEGKIVDAYAKRPSDPKLRMQLEQLVK